MSAFFQIRFTKRVKRLQAKEIAEEGNIDLEMLNNIENDTETQDLPLDSDIRQLLSFRIRMSVVTLDAGTRLIVKDESEILIPRILRRQMLEICIIHIVQMKRC